MRVLHQANQPGLSLMQTSRPPSEPRAVPDRLDVRLDLDSQGFVAQFVRPPSSRTGEYAFYLNRDGERVETRWYTEEPIARFAAIPRAGKYVALGFARERDSPAAIRATSRPIEVPETCRPVARPAKSPFPAALPVRSIEELSTTIAPHNVQRLDVRIGGLEYAVLKHPRKGDSMFVVLGGAVPDRSTITLPRFNRFTWTDDFPGTLVCIADPSLTLDPEIRLGWYFGNLADDAIAGMEALIEKLATTLGVHLDRVFTYGSSGGGFAALQLAARLGRGATAVAINAQTEALDYSVQSSVQKFLSVCVGGMDKADARRRYPLRLSALEAWSTPRAASARCLLVQNVRDLHHHNRHYLPFLERHGICTDGTSPDGRLGSMLYEHADGHAAEPRGMLPAILGRAMELRLVDP